MHGYSITRKSIRKKFPEFKGGGQFFILSSKFDKEDLGRFMEIQSDRDLRALLKELEIVEGEALAYRGEIQKLGMSINKREIQIYFSWLCVQHRGFGGSRPRWVPVHKVKGCTQCMKIGFTGGYFPKGGHRIKVWTTLNMFTNFGEYCRFYKPGDPDNLVWNGDEFIPLCQIQLKPSQKD